MKNFLKHFLLLLPLLFLVSCFDILDKVNVKADGSGEYSLILNASKSKTRLASISKMETINGKKVPKKVKSRLKLMKRQGSLKTFREFQTLKRPWILIITSSN